MIFECENNEFISLKEHVLYEKNINKIIFVKEINEEEFLIVSQKYILILKLKNFENVQIINFRDEILICKLVNDIIGVFTENKSVEIYEKKEKSSFELVFHKENQNLSEFFINDEYFAFSKWFSNEIQIFSQENFQIKFNIKLDNNSIIHSIFIKENMLYCGLNDGILKIFRFEENKIIEDKSFKYGNLPIKLYFIDKYGIFILSDNCFLFPLKNTINFNEKFFFEETFEKIINFNSELIFFGGNTLKIGIIDKNEEIFVESYSINENHENDLMVIDFIDIYFSFILFGINFIDSSFAIQFFDFEFKKKYFQIKIDDETLNSILIFDNLLIIGSEVVIKFY